MRDRYGPPDVLQVGEVDTPVPGEGEVLVKVRAASLNTADIDYLRGRPRIARMGSGLRRPRSRRMGLDLAGTVEGVGPGVTSIAPGDEVWADMFSHGQSSLAEYVCASESAFHPKPAKVSFADSASVPHSGVLALQGLRGRGPIRAGERVLINGAGGCVGPFAVQIAKSFGAEVTAVDHTGKLEMLSDIGADHVIDYTREDFTKNGERYDLILDIAATRSILRLRRSLVANGRYVQIARTLGGFFRALLVGAVVSVTGRKRMGVFVWTPNKREDLDVLKGLLEGGEIEPLIDRRLSLDDVPEAFAYLEGGLARGKLVVLPGGSEDL